jgi:uncharacterized protein (UPF0335 family)
MMQLQDLLALLPKGTWSSDGDVLIDPKGRRVNIRGTWREPAPDHLYAETIAKAFNELPTLLSQLTAQTQRVSDALKEAKHCADRVRQAYNQALTDALDVVYTQQVVTVSAQHALEALVPQIERLRKDDAVPSLQSS